MKNEECLVLNSLRDGCLPSEFIASHHVHLLVRRGTMTFSDGRRNHRASAGDLAIWQMSNSIGHAAYSPDFECEFLIVAPQFLVHFNPEMAWASRGYVFIRLHPVFPLDKAGRETVEAGFSLLRHRQGQTLHPFRRELLGRALQMFLFDLWHIYSDGIASLPPSNNTAQIFFRFLTLVQADVITERSVAHYADRLCITPKYLSQVCRSVAGGSAMQWIGYYASFELVSRLDDAGRTLSDIADEMGFSSLQFFSRYTKKLLGLSPSDYRHSKGI